MMQPKRVLLEYGALGISLLCGFASCSGNPNVEATPAGHGDIPPATVDQIAKDLEQNVVVLSESAEQRLGIVTVAVERKSVTNRRLYGGTIVPLPEQTASITAPLTGTLLEIMATGTSGEVVGTSVAKGQTLLALLPLNAGDEAALSAVERDQLAISQFTIARARVDATARLDSARVQVSAAQTAYDRAVKLLEDKVGSQRAVDEAKAALSIAREAYGAAQAEIKALNESTEDSLATRPVTLLAPFSGTVQALHAVVGETVYSGQPLIDIANVSTVRVRLPIPSAELNEILIEEQGVVQPLGGELDETPVTCRFVQGQPTADPLMSTTDLYCEFSPTEASYRIGQRVAVNVSAKGSGEHLVVPVSAVLYDVYGGSWVYVKRGPQEYERTRIEILFTVADMAVLSRGPSEGTEVVTDGAAELFGTEFGNDK